MRYTYMSVYWHYMRSVKSIDNDDQNKKNQWTKRHIH